MQTQTPKEKAREEAAVLHQPPAPWPGAGRQQQSDSEAEAPGSNVGPTCRRPVALSPGLVRGHGAEAKNPEAHTQK